jgi:glycosyltransferase involved in cell wall biosynthesis
VTPIGGDSRTGVGIKRIIELLAFTAAAAKRLRQMRPDVVIADPPPSSGIAILLSGAGTKVYYIADSWSEMLNQGAGRLGRLISKTVWLIESMVMRRVDMVIAVRDNLGSLAEKAGAQRVTVAPYGTDVSVFCAAGDGWDAGPEKNSPFFLYAGNYGVVHGASVFLKAAELLWTEGWDFRVVFMGYGSEFEAIATAAHRFPGRFISLPPMPAEVAAAAHRSAVASLASMRPVAVTEQTRPAKALASVACGCPVILAAGAGTFSEEVIKNRLGLAVPWEPQAAAEAMRQLLAGDVRGSGEIASREDIAEYGLRNYDMRGTAKALVQEITDLGRP